MDTIPDEILVATLALIPYSKDQLKLLRQVSTRFRNAVDSPSWRKQVAENQYPVQSILSGTAGPVDQERLDGYVDRSLKIGEAVQILSLPTDQKPQMLMLENGVQLLDHIKSVFAEHNLTKVQRLEWMQYLMTAGLFKECAVAAMRCVLYRLFDLVSEQSNLRPTAQSTEGGIYARLPRRILSKIPDFLHMSLNYLAFESTILLSQIHQPFLRSVSERTATAWHQEFMVFLHATTITLVSQIFPSYIRATLTPGQQKRASYLRSFQWRVLSAGGFGRRTMRLSHRTALPKGIRGVEAVFDEYKRAAVVSVVMEKVREDLIATAFSTKFWRYLVRISGLLGEFARRGRRLPDTEIPYPVDDLIAYLLTN